MSKVLGRLSRDEAEDWKFSFQVPEEQQETIKAVLRTEGGSALLMWLFKMSKAGSPLPKTDFEQGMAAVYWIVRGVADGDIVRSVHERI